MPTITNFNVDTVASGIGGIYGPLSRLTNMGSLPVPNENHSIQFVTALGNHVFMSYEQLTTTAVRNRILGQAGGINENVQDLKTAVAAVYAITNAFSAPHTYDDYVAAINAIRTNIMPFMKGLY